MKGRYVSVERIVELDNGNTEWRMATSSTPGGFLPNFLVESTMAKTIAAVRYAFSCLSMNNGFFLLIVPSSI